MHLPLFDSAFWAAFWPSLFSTLVGVALGLPTGLWINRLGLHASGRADREEQQERLKRALRVVDDALAANSQGLAPLATLVPGTYVTAPNVNSAAWDAVRLEVIPNLHDPELQGALADYFAEVEVVLRLNDRYLDHVIGVSSALGGAPQVQETLRQHVSGRATKTITAGATLRSKLTSHLA